jgi:hypothetical protein
MDKEASVNDLASRPAGYSGNIKVVNAKSRTLGGRSSPGKCSGTTKTPLEQNQI